jgi:hypothetical protein
MPIFARRRLQAMLDRLSDAGKGADLKNLLSRLNSRKEVDQAIPAEMELALLWALAELGPVTLEPAFGPKGGRPDALTNWLVEGQAAAIEIATTNDGLLSGEEAMDRIAQIISDCASRARKGVGAFLYFSFNVAYGTRDGSYQRWRLAPSDYELSEHAAETIRTWIESSACDSERLRLIENGLDVTIEKKAYKQTRYHNIWSAMPTETRSVEANPLAQLLKRKSRQLRAVPPGTLKIIFVADGGSELLNQLGRYGGRNPMNYPVTAAEIISAFMTRNAGKVDALVTFSAVKEHSAFQAESRRRWSVNFFGSAVLSEIPETLYRVAALLPLPHYEGYQARSLYRQGVFRPGSRGEYLGMTIKGMAKGPFRVEFPARMLLDLLAGRLTPAMFEAQMTRGGRDNNLFRTWLDQGCTISGAEMAPRHVDEDDDHLILHFSDDPAARPLLLKDNLPEPQDPPDKGRNPHSGSGSIID